MRILVWIVAAVIGLGPQGEQRIRKESTTPTQSTEKSGTTANPQPSAPVYSKIAPVDHGHPAEQTRGTPPCGTPGANCSLPPDPQTHDDSHLGRNVAIGVGVGLLAGVVIGSLAKGPGPVKKLSDNGPQFPQTLHMSLFQATGFVKGGWPLVVEYESIAPTRAVLTIVAQDTAPHAVLLPTDQTGRRNVIIQLPLSLGTTLKIANFTIRSTVSDVDPSPRYFRVYGFGCGRRAVGSVAIDQLKFLPETITPAQTVTNFGFHTHTNFDRMKAEFLQVTMVDHCLEGEIFDDKKINQRVSEDQYWNDTWNARKAHPGQIQFRVRGWFTADRGGDWVSAFSPDLVLKR